MTSQPIGYTVCCSYRWTFAIVAAIIAIGAAAWRTRLVAGRNHSYPAIRQPPAAYEAVFTGGLKRKMLSDSVPLYSVEKFLSEKECAEIIALARPRLERSEMMLTDAAALQAGWQRALVLCLAEMADHRVLSLPSSRCDPLVRRSFSHPTMTLADAAALMQAASVDRDRDGEISRVELTTSLQDQRAALSAVTAFFMERPELRLRHSQTAWLDHIPEASALRKSLADRLSLVSSNNFTVEAGWDIGAAPSDDMLSELRISGRRNRAVAQLQFQVVRYPPGGHYTCHLDSGRDSARRRLLTLVAFLQAPEAGGSLTFPLTSSQQQENVRQTGQVASSGSSGKDVKKEIAHGDDAGERALKQWLRGEEPSGFVTAATRRAAMESATGSVLDDGSDVTLVEHFLRKANSREMATAASMSDKLAGCWEFGMLVPPPKSSPPAQAMERGTHILPEPGRAVMWYNHRFSSRRGGFLMNEDHAESLHCGCVARGSGEKWILNVWPTYGG